VDERLENPNKGVHKAAALVMMLGLENSSKVLQQLGEDEMVRVMAAMNEGASLPLELRKEAVKEAFSLLGAGSSVSKSGANYMKQLLARTIGPRRSAEFLERISALQQATYFEALRANESVHIASLLSEEHPQTIALVLSYLDPKQSAEIMSQLSAELQSEVSWRLATMNRVSTKVIEIIERGLKQKITGLISLVGMKETGGVSSLVKILNQVDRGVQKSIFEALKNVDSDLVDEIQANMFTFDDLEKLDDRTLQRILRDVNKQDLSLALKGAPELLREAIFRNLSERARESLQEEIEFLGPQLAKNVYAAQRRIVDAVRALDEAEEISLSSGGAGNDVII
jgi:flagellar motor switch protein FliG